MQIMTAGSHTYGMNEVLLDRTFDDFATMQFNDSKGDNKGAKTSGVGSKYHCINGPKPFRRPIQIVLNFVKLLVLS